MSLLAKRGFIATGNLLMAGVFIFLVGILGFNLFSSKKPTTIFLETPKNTFSVGEEVTFTMYVTSEVPFNALDVLLEYSNDRLEITSVDYSDSVIDLWVVEPAYSNTEGHLVLTGGSTKKGGVTGKNKILSITAKPLKRGRVDMSFSNSIILAHDGKGTDLEETVIDTEFIVNNLDKAGGSARVVRSTNTTSYAVLETLEGTPLGTTTELTAPAVYAGDLNNDGTVSITDLSIFLTGSKKDDGIVRDLNGDGKVGIRDVSILLSNMLRN